MTWFSWLMLGFLTGSIYGSAMTNWLRNLRERR